MVARVDLDMFTTEGKALAHPDLWDKVALMVESEEMPPRNRRKQPSDEQREKLVDWVQTVSGRWDAGEFGKDPGRTTIRRLNKNEYNYTMRDLFNLQIRPADGFPEESGGEAGSGAGAGATRRWATRESSVSRTGPPRW